MPHHVADENARFLVGDAHDMKKIAAHQAGRLIEMGETKARGLGGGGRGKERVLLGQERLLQFHRHAQIGFHLLVLRPDLALLGFELENVPAQKRVLHFEKRLGGNQPDEIPGAIDQQDVVVKFLVPRAKTVASTAPMASPTVMRISFLRRCLLIGSRAKSEKP